MAPEQVRAPVWLEPWLDAAAESRQRVFVTVEQLDVWIVADGLRYLLQGVVGEGVIRVQPDDECLFGRDRRRCHRRRLSGIAPHDYPLIPRLISREHREHGGRRSRLDINAQLPVRIPLIQHRLQRPS